MKKLLMIALCASLSVTTNAQPFVQMGIGNTVHAGVGILASGIEVTAAYQFPFSNTLKPSVASLSAGKQFLLSDYDENNFSFVASIGVAYLSRKDFSQYDNEVYHTQSLSETEAEYSYSNKITAIKAIYGLEFGKHWNQGRLYINTQCSDGRLMIGAGMRYYFE